MVSNEMSTRSLAWRLACNTLEEVKTSASQTRGASKRVVLCVRAGVICISAATTQSTLQQAF